MSQLNQKGGPLEAKPSKYRPLWTFFAFLTVILFLLVVILAIYIMINDLTSTTGYYILIFAFVVLFVGYILIML